jgi:tryptophan-rich sensory protein
LLAALPVALALLAGQAATYPNLAWYATLTKPSFNPPNWVFGPVWLTLYILMFYGAWRLLRLPEGTTGRASALFLFYAQLVLNALWSWLFFAMESPAAGFIDIIPQLLLILLLIVQAYRLDRIAALCFVPLAAWVGFAAVLNFSIWQLNG